MALERRRLLSQCSERTVSGDSPSFDPADLLSFKGVDDSPTATTSGGPSTPMLCAVGTATPKVVPADPPSSGPAGDVGAAKPASSPPPLSLGPPSGAPPLAAIMSPSPHRLVACRDLLVCDDYQEEGSLCIWNRPSSVSDVDASSVLASRSVKVHDALVNDMCYLDALGLFLTASDDGTVKAWNVDGEDWECVRTCKPGDDCGASKDGPSPVTALGVCGKFIVAGVAHVVGGGEAGYVGSGQQASGGGATAGAASGASAGAGAGAGAGAAESVAAPSGLKGEDETATDPSSLRGVARLVVYDTSNGWSAVTVIPGAHERYVFDIAGIASRWVCSIGDDWTLRVWDSQSEWKLQSEVVGSENSQLCCTTIQSITPLTLLATGANRGKVQLWKVDEPWPLHSTVTLETTSPISAVTALYRGSKPPYLVTGDNSPEGRISLWEYGIEDDDDENLSWVLSASFPAHIGGVAAMASFSLDGTETHGLASVGHEGSLKVWTLPEES